MIGLLGATLLAGNYLDVWTVLGIAKLPTPSRRRLAAALAAFCFFVAMAVLAVIISDLLNLERNNRRSTDRRLWIFGRAYASCWAAGCCLFVIARMTNRVPSVSTTPTISEMTAFCTKPATM